MRVQYLVLSLVLCVLLCGSVVESTQRQKKKHFIRHAALVLLEPCWGLDARGYVYALGRNYHFTKIPGRQLNYLDIKVYNGQVHAWGIDKYQDIFHRVGETGQWTHFKGRKLKFLRIQSSNRIWGINDQDDVYTANTQTGVWQQIPGKFKYLDVQANGRVWAITRDNDVFTRGPEGGDWVAIPERKMTKIRVIDNGRLWSIDPQYYTFTRDGVNGQWVNIPGALANFDANNNGEVYGLAGGDQIFYKNSVAGDWRLIAGLQLHNIRVTDSGKVYGINKYNEAFLMKGPTGQGIKLPGAQLVKLYGPDNRPW